MKDKIILASRSVVRRKILNKNGINCEVIPANVDEDQVKESLINERGVIVGYDTRFGSKEFAIQISNIFLSVGIDTYLVTEPTPTPVITSEVISRGCDMGIIITASHNDWKWNGIKLRNSTGSSNTSGGTYLYYAIAESPFKTANAR